MHMARGFYKEQVGLAAAEEAPHGAERDLVREAAAKRRANLDQKFEEGSLEEAALRALLYLRLADGAFRRARLSHAPRHPRATQVERPHQAVSVQGHAERRNCNCFAWTRNARSRPCPTSKGSRTRHRLGMERDAAARRSAGCLEPRGSASLGPGREVVRRGLEANPKPKGRECLTLTPERRQSRTTNTIAS